MKERSVGVSLSSGTSKIYGWSVWTAWFGVLFVIAGAALDVTEPEPLPRDHALLRCRNLTLTPHVGTATRKTRVEMCRLALANLVAGLGLPPREGEPRAVAAVNEEALSAAAGGAGMP